MSTPDVWLVCGNKGGVGKSVVSKTLIEYFVDEYGDAIAVDGDTDGDVAKAYAGRIAVFECDLATPPGWADFTDWLCTTNFPDDDMHIVVNLPDAVTARTLSALERYKPAADDLGIRSHAFFVMNSLADGLPTINRLFGIVGDVYPVKNLFFGASADFTVFDRRYARHFPDTTIYFPRMQPRLMNEIRSTNLTFTEAMNARPGSPCSMLLHRLETSLWLERAKDSIAEVME